MTQYRTQESFRARVTAAKAAKDRPHPAHLSNGDEQKFAGAHFAMSFTKGLEHDLHTGLVAKPDHFGAF
ncbi:hypothetical protein [Sulfitobacter sp. SK012]|uniref:hypothetical protein n=1 Tax=Sulfitobacter sp. SK012 TaxID=1389005 RepID=UPI001C1F80E6|nr:hypothetical protein [Sulfitobacter sp. SK012]